MTALVEGDLASGYRQAYRAQFRAELAAGTRGPFLVPLYFVFTHVLPALYLALPHRRRPRLYRARWLVLALCAAGVLRALCGVAAGSIVMGDPLTPAFVLAVALVVAGLILVNRPK